MTTVSVEDLGRLALFAGVPADEIEAIARSCDSESFAEGEWIIRAGDDGSRLYMIVDGEVTVVIDGEDRRVLSKGSFFGEISALLDEPASASVVVRSPLSCLTVPSDKVEDFLLAHPLVMFRMLRAEARRLQNAVAWRT